MKDSSSAKDDSVKGDDKQEKEQKIPEKDIDNEQPLIGVDPSPSTHYKHEGFLTGRERIDLRESITSALKLSDLTHGDLLKPKDKKKGKTQAHYAAEEGDIKELWKRSYNNKKGSIEKTFQNKKGFHLFRRRF
ncbi:uncharacterized protein [Halyomorpha halys]|uniref:uncharacterized protein isoform X3 n=1 Tax=Halyomorpha halys TaxID=286706 RepID=UPI0006D4D498|nr:uncharacterized protein LOC106679819 isoform X2 [Halyomorpha halys]